LEEWSCQGQDIKGNSFYHFLNPKTCASTAITTRFKYVHYV
jgi:hypothetical protein